jgi:hypothetical protein
MHITQDGYALYELGENSITLSPNDMESIISSANQYARDLSIILVLLVRMEYVYKRLPLIYLKRLLLFDESYQV